MIANRIRVKGKVQGVFFRASTEEKANQLGLKGWVRNEPDGSVLIEIEGKEEPIRDFKQWCTIGPSAAQVETVKVEEIEKQGFTRFEVRH
ncbi:acylphosphatase [Ekhidna sp.]|uniref:acylphosphatase n=1 Tax=Ekhidna sp. TaxID=2608089 RepID=UPI003CCBEE7F